MTAIGLSIASLVLGWLLYDLLCKSPLGNDDTLLMLVLYVILVFLAWGFTQIFSGRAAFLHLGAVTATIMSANVFLIIIPNQKIVVADLIAGRKPDPKYGKIAKTRSTHNNYLTLPVLFLMLSNHYPLAFATQFNWIIASIVFIIGVLIRHFFNTMHARKGKPYWTWLVATILFIVIIWLSTVPKVLTGESRASSSAEILVASTHFPACARHGARPLRHVPCDGAVLRRHLPCAEGRDPGERRSDRRACQGNLSASGPQPRHAAGQRHADHAAGAGAAGDMVRGSAAVA